MQKERNLQETIDELGIVAMEDFGVGDQESVFAALDAIREYTKQHPEEKLIEMMKEAQKKRI